MMLTYVCLSVWRQSRTLGQSQKVKAALLTAVLTRQAVAAVSVWERIGREKLLFRCGLLGGARLFGAHSERRGAGGISWQPPAYSLLSKISRRLAQKFHSVAALNKPSLYLHCPSASVYKDDCFCIWLMSTMSFVGVDWVYLVSSITTFLEKAC